MEKADPQRRADRIRCEIEKVGAAASRCAQLMNFIQNTQADHDDQRYAIQCE